MKWMILLAAALSLAITACSGFVFVPWLHKIKCGQPIKEIGPTWHKKKSGTPTMGGIMFISGVLVSMAVLALLVTQRYPDLTPDLPETAVATRRLILGIAAALLFSAVGFIDDYLKVVRHNNAGLRGWYKIFLQVAIAGAYLASLAIWGGQTTTAFFPFLGTAGLGIFYWVLSMLMIVGVVNAVNLTDGLDGLAILPCVMVGSALGIFAYVVGRPDYASYLYFSYIPGAGELVVVCAAMAGAGLAFLWFNAYPAQVFMGDVGALALGGALGTIAVIVRQEIVLAIMGGIFVVETLSVMIQTVYFRLSHGKRVFLMAPIHHHFELKGWKETQVVVRFWIITFILVLIGLATLKIR